MSCMVLVAPRAAMATKQFVSTTHVYEAPRGSVEYMEERKQSLRMNWVVVSDENGKRGLRMRWTTDD